MAAARLPVRVSFMLPDRTAAHEQLNGCIHHACA